MFSLSNLNKKYLTAEIKMNCVSWALKALKYSYDVDFIVFHWNDFFIGFVPIVSTFYWCWFVSLGVGEVHNRKYPKS